MCFRMHYLLLALRALAAYQWRLRWLSIYFAKTKMNLTLVAHAPIAVR